MCTHVHLLEVVSINRAGSASAPSSVKEDTVMIVLNKMQKFKHHFRKCMYLFDTQLTALCLVGFNLNTKLPQIIHCHKI